MIAKDGARPYRPGVRAMFKVKHQRTVDCVVCGYRLHKAAAGRDRLAAARALRQDGEGPSWAGEVGGLVPIGATASFPLARRRELLTELRPLEIPRAEHPGARSSSRRGNRWNPAREQQFVALVARRA